MNVNVGKNKIKVLDLFCGAGGFSYGFQQAGFKIVAGIDNDKRVKETFEKNHPDAEFILADITEVSIKNFLNVDIVIGSPPCPEFSRAKANPDPKKGMILVNQFLKWISLIKPKYWIGENVSGLMKYLDNDTLSMAFGKKIKKKILDCVNYGVPQFRKRLFFGKYPVPKPTHAKGRTFSLTGNILKKWVTVRDAIGDLIELINNEIYLTDQIGNNTKSHTPIYNATTRPSRAVTSIPQRQIMNLEMTKSTQKSIQHKFDCNFGMQKRYNNFSLDKPSITITDMHGDSPIIEISNLESLKTHDKVYDRCLNVLDKPAKTLITFRSTHHVKINELNYSSYKINEYPKSYVKCRKKYRRLTIRECARLQSFPDSFIFYGSKTACYKMIGNAVPPLMAYHLAMAIRSEMNENTR
nr:MAG: m5C DNA methyltransferase [Lokiarchaeota virus Ratatoskr Meg22_1012]